MKAKCPHGVRPKYRCPTCRNQTHIKRMGVSQVARDRYLKACYGLVPGDYDHLLRRQGGGCAGCGTVPEPGTYLDVDHCHTTGRVRGVLCTPCNTGLGQLRDNPAILLSLIRYLGGLTV